MLGKGNTAEVFEYGDGKVCKLFFAGYPQKYVEHEYQNANEVYRLNLNVPKPFGLVSIESRNGIVYERIDGESLFSYRKNRIIDELIDLFTRFHREWIGKRSDQVLSYKEFLSIMIQNGGKEQKELMEEICALPDDNCLLHGDFHFNNVLVKHNGSIPVAIDFMNVCHGPALYDIARTFFLLDQMDCSVANMYLKKMKVSITDIEPFMKVIRKCRKFEI